MVVRVEAEWDDDARVWSIRSDDVPGLNIEADDYPQIEPKAVAAISDLAEHSPHIAALIGQPLDIHTLRHSRLAVA